MVQYIYFVKCPNCEDEPFDFFNDAKGYALGCMSSKPIITQVEVNRNDFGECVDSHDLGTVWSWEDMMKDVPMDNELTTFSKGETLDFDYDPDQDPEFLSMDNTLDSIPDNFKISNTAAVSVSETCRKPITENNAVLAATRAPKDSDYIIVSKHANGSYSFLGNNYRMTRQLNKAMTYTSKVEAEHDIKYAEDQAEASSINYDNYVNDPFFVTTFSEAKKLLDDRDAFVKQRNAKVAARSALNDEVRELAREMYEQGTACNTFEEFEAFMLENGYDKPTKYLYYSTYRDELMFCTEMDKAKKNTKAEAFCERKPIPEGMTIEQLVEELEENEDEVECKCCSELYDKGECHYEVDFGWLCSGCEAAIKSRGETLTFREGSY